MCFSPRFLQILFSDMFIACYNVFYSYQSALAIGNFDQDVYIDHVLKFMIFESAIHVLVKNSNDQKILETVKNILIGDEHIRKMSARKGAKKDPENWRNKYEKYI